jgi:hypothetical protein
MDSKQQKSSSYSGQRPQTRKTYEPRNSSNSFVPSSNKDEPRSESRTTEEFQIGQKPYMRKTYEPRSQDQTEEPQIRQHCKLCLTGKACTLKSRAYQHHPKDKVSHLNSEILSEIVGIVADREKEGIAHPILEFRRYYSKSLPNKLVDCRFCLEGTCNHMTPGFFHSPANVQGIDKETALAMLLVEKPFKNQPNQKRQCRQESIKDHKSLKWTKRTKLMNMIRQTIMNQTTHQKVNQKLLQHLKFLQKLSLTQYEWKLPNFFIKDKNKMSQPIQTTKN